MRKRIDRISEEIKKEISTILLNEIKDPRLPNLTTVVEVKAAGDLRYASVYISVMGSDEDKKNALLALKSAAGFIRKEIGQRLMIRYTPELRFILDESMEYGAHISKILNDTLGKGDSK